MTLELRKIISSADGMPVDIRSYKDLGQARVNGSINVLVEDHLFEQIEYVARKFDVQIISKDQFYNFCLKQHISHKL